MEKLTFKVVDLDNFNCWPFLKRECLLLIRMKQRKNINALAEEMAGKPALVWEPV